MKNARLCTELTKQTYLDNLIDSLDITDNIKLECLHSSRTRFARLNVTNNTTSKSLYSNFDLIDNLNMTKNPKLILLNFYTFSMESWKLNKIYGCDSSLPQKDVLEIVRN